METNNTLAPETEVEITADASLMAVEERNETWENNHALISKAYAEFMRSNQRIPTRTELALKTGLTRKTIYKHLIEFATHPSFLERQKELGLMTTNLMARMFTYAMNGDVKAARLYFQIIRQLPSRGLNEGIKELGK